MYQRVIAIFYFQVDEPEDPDNPPDINAAGASERRPIHRAAGGNHADIIKYLLEKGATVDIVDKSSRTALHWAATSGQVEAAQALIDGGANPFAVTSIKATILHSACESGWADFVDFILTVVGDRKEELFTASDGDGKRPLELAVEVSAHHSFYILFELNDCVAIFLYEGKACSSGCKASERWRPKCT
jgi:ankyrin repeat protein